MTTPRDPAFGYEATEADIAEQLIPVDVDDEEGGIDPARVALSRTYDADEADLIEQSIAVPLTDDDPDLER
ncbi:hypothetical protein JRC04_01145 [Mycolicibacterium sp. S2-37]|uniref:hypothetical protein n=1 Tax=Mycolicibacterium sp. S2-37 TaxID=2810297 RepID=UPI001A9428E7|nr:hypothetical protein [Mycolicibacterium sp. S2-37]MBO0676061.1 hypothetical protein [Mycolicibacterium sp. S2-37]